MAGPVGGDHWVPTPQRVGQLRHQPGVGAAVGTAAPPATVVLGRQVVVAADVYHLADTVVEPLGVEQAVETGRAGPACHGCCSGMSSARLIRRHRVFIGIRALSTSLPVFDRCLFI